jgi:acid stress chaperone HdeB
MKSIMAGLLFCLVAILSARAQVTIDVSKITCKEFLHDTITVPDNIAYWLNGYYNGKRGNTAFDVNTLKDHVDKVESYCLENQDLTVMQAAEILFGLSK